MDSLEELTKEINDFAKARDWDQFHSPKNLVMALAGEVGELTEHFQWLSEDQSRTLGKKSLSAVADEIADVQIYLIRLADKLDIKIVNECQRKIDENNEKYPVDKSKGSAAKYTEYQG